MRRISLAALVLTLATPFLAPGSAAPSLFAPAQQSSPDAAIAKLRAAVKANPSDAAAKDALIQALEAMRVSLLQQAEQLRAEMSTLRSAGAQAACGGRAPIRVGGDIKPPHRTHDVNPAYPPEALAARVAGTVVAEIAIGCAGEVASVAVLKGVPMLNDAAVSAIKQWRYTPTLLNGDPVPVIMTVTVSFTPADL